MSGSYAASRAEIRNFVRMFKNLVAIDEHLEEAGGLEKDIADKKTLSAEIDAEISKLQAALAGLQSEHAERVARSEEEAKSIRLDAELALGDAEAKRTAAAEHLARAKADAEALINEGKATASDHVKSGEASIADAKANADKIINDARAEAARIAQDAQIQTERLAEIRAQIDSENKTLAAVKAEIDRIRSKFVG